MAALPYMQLYVADYLGDTFYLTTEEHGAYLLLMMTYWQSGKPIHKSRLAAAAKLTDERWADVERTLNEFFTEDENGYWNHSRIDADLARVNAKSTQASKAGKASAAKRGGAKPTENKDNSNGRSTPVQRTLNHTDTDTDTNTYFIKELNKYSDNFEELWKECPKRAGNNPKKVAAKAGNARLKEGHKHEEILAGAKRWKAFAIATGKEGTEFLMQVSTFLGPSEAFLQPWTLPIQPAKQAEPGKLERAMKSLSDARDNDNTGNGGTGTAGHVSQTTPQLPKS